MSLTGLICSIFAVPSEVTGPEKFPVTSLLWFGFKVPRRTSYSWMNKPICSNARLEIKMLVDDKRKSWDEYHPADLVAWLTLEATWFLKRLLIAPGNKRADICVNLQGKAAAKGWLSQQTTANVLKNSYKSVFCIACFVPQICLRSIWGVCNAHGM